MTYDNRGEGPTLLGWVPPRPYRALEPRTTTAPSACRESSVEPANYLATRTALRARGLEASSCL